jgi:hypothetical protein
MFMSVLDEVVGRGAILKALTSAASGSASLSSLIGPGLIVGCSSTNAEDARRRLFLAVPALSPFTVS